MSPQARPAKQKHTPLWGGGTTQWWVRFCEVSSDLSSSLQEVTTSSTASGPPSPQVGKVIFTLLSFVGKYYLTTIKEDCCNFVR